MAQRLADNRNIAFQGIGKVGDFDIPETVAAEWITQTNPHGRSNAEVLKRWVNGTDITQGPRGVMIIDFGVDMTAADAALYEAPFEYVKEKVMPARVKNKMRWRAENWWLHGYPATEMRDALSPLQCYIGTSVTAKHRFFVWLPGDTLPSNSVVAIASDDDYMLGILNSKIHTVWAYAMGTQLREAQSGLRYTPTTCFETFPFPEPTGEQREVIALAAAELNRLRENDTRTLTDLYNARPTWLDNARRALDAAVSAAYGWPADLSDGEIPERLLALNLQRAG